jgi:hypothetical protein
MSWDYVAMSGGRAASCNLESFMSMAGWSE